MKKFAVVDFETTGLCAGADRIIEVAAIIVVDGVVVSTFSELMDPGAWIPPFITELTGISNAMVRGKPRPEKVMPRLRDFLGDCVCIAHNASFDRRFFAAEMELAGAGHSRAFLCTMLLARRLIHRVPNHRLGTLARHLQLANPSGLQAHRALADVLMTSALWEHLTGILRERLKGRTPDIDVIEAITKKPKAAVEGYLDAVANGRGPLLKTG